MYIKNSKRFMIILETWSPNSFKQEVTEYDSEEEGKEYIKLINSVFDNYSEKDSKGNKKSWGYVFLDFKTLRIILWGGPENRIYPFSKKDNNLLLKDKFFRGDDEVPKDYVWDIGEYDGWLQFRWGDGKNAIGYKPKSKKKENLEIDNIEEEENEYIQEKFDKEIDKEKITKKFDRW